MAGTRWLDKYRKLISCSKSILRRSITRNNRLEKVLSWPFFVQPERSNCKRKIFTLSIKSTLRLITRINFDSHCFANWRWHFLHQFSHPEHIASIICSIIAEPQRSIFTLLTLQKPKSTLREKKEKNFLAQKRSGNCIGALKKNSFRNAIY